jgi:GT2 family glycosyltransferase
MLFFSIIIPTYNRPERLETCLKSLTCLNYPRDRWLYLGYRMIYLPEALVYHTHHLSLSRFWRQHFNYGRGAYHFHQLRSKRDREPIKVEPFTFYFDLLRYPFSVSSSHPSVLLAGLFVVSQVANVAGFFWERLHRNSNSSLQFSDR